MVRVKVNTFLVMIENGSYSCFPLSEGELQVSVPIGHCGPLLGQNVVNKYGKLTIQLMKLIEQANHSVFL